MKQPKLPKETYRDLHQRAEELLKSYKPVSEFDSSTSEILKLIHELEVQKVELVMQNDELIHAKLQSEQLANKYAELYDFAPTGYFTLSKKGIISELNLRAALMLERNRSDVLNTPLSRYIHHRSIPDYLDFLNQVMESKDSLNCDLKMEVPSGNELFVRLSSVYSENHKACLTTMMDITRCRKAEEKNDSFRQVFEKSLNEIYIFDQQTLKFIYANNQAINNLGFSMEELEGLTPLDIKPDFSKQKFDTLLQPLREKSLEKLVFETRHQRKNGSDYRVEVHLHNSEFMERETYLAIILDITEQARLMNLLEQEKQQLKLANQEKDKFFSIIAHDLRSPFNFFLGSTQLLQEEYDQLSDESIRQLISGLHLSAQKQFELLENLLEWARMKQGQIVVKTEEINLNRMVNNVIQSLADSAMQKNIEISTSYPSQLSLMGDPRMLEAVLRNLLSNAVKFTPEGGKILIDVAPGNDHSLRFSVSDNGMGMSKDMLPHLFRLDAHTHRPGTRGEPGSGLGLHLCKEFVEKHGGQLRADSTEGVGSTFHFTIPQPIPSKDA